MIHQARDGTYYTISGHVSPTCPWCHQHGLRGYSDAEDCTCIDWCGYADCGGHEDDTEPAA